MGSVGSAGAEPIRMEARGAIVVVTYLGEATDEQYAAYLSELTKLVTETANQHPRLALVHDASAWIRSSARQRQLQADWIKEQLPLLKMKRACSAYVFKSALIRHSLTAVMWLVPTLGPHKVCATLAEAIAWCEQYFYATSGGNE